MKRWPQPAEAGEPPELFYEVLKLHTLHLHTSSDKARQLRIDRLQETRGAISRVSLQLL